MEPTPPMSVELMRAPSTAVAFAVAVDAPEVAAAEAELSIDAKPVRVASLLTSIPAPEAASARGLLLARRPSACSSFAVALAPRPFSASTTVSEEAVLLSVVWPMTLATPPTSRPSRSAPWSFSAAAVESASPSVVAAEAELLS